MPRVLCTTDFSPLSEQTVNYAGRLCGAAGFRLTLMNVPSLFPPGGQSVRSTTPPITTIKELLASQCVALIERFQLACDFQLLESRENLTNTITAYGKDFDLLVTGIDGEEALYSSLVDTNAFEVSRRSSVPWLVIPKDCLSRPIASLVHVFEGERQNDFGLSQLLSFARNIQAKITLLKVTGNHDEVNHDVKMHENSSTAYSNQEVTFDWLASKQIGDSVNQYMLKGHVDALAVCSAHRGLLNKLFRGGGGANISELIHYPLFLFHH